jgi:hypothetical protein
MKGNDDAEHAQELPTELESEDFSGGDQGAEDDYGTSAVVPRESEFDREMKEGSFRSSVTAKPEI